MYAFEPALNLQFDFFPARPRDALYCPYKELKFEYVLEAESQGEVGYYCDCCDPSKKRKRASESESEDDEEVSFRRVLFLQRCFIINFKILNVESGLTFYGAILSGKLPWKECEGILLEIFALLSIKNITRETLFKYSKNIISTFGLVHLVVFRHTSISVSK